MLKMLYREAIALLTAGMLAVMNGISVVFVMQVLAAMSAYKLDAAIPFWSAILVGAITYVAVYTNSEFDHTGDY
jgi:hypothetical protein